MNDLVAGVSDASPPSPWVESVGPARAGLLVLRGLDMIPAQLAPIVASLRLPAMLALDAVLQDPPLAVDALSLWSASRMASGQWAPALHRLRGVRVELRHGTADANIGIAAARGLRDALVAGGSDVRCAPFDGGQP